MKKKKVAMLSAIVFLVAHGALAASFSVSEQVLSIPNREDDVYAVGGMVSLGEPITEDLVAAGGQLVIDNTVGGDVLAGGGTVTVNGAVGDDVRAAGGTISLHGAVGGDAVLGGGNIIVGSQVTVGRDLVVAGGSLLVNGAVSRNVELYGGEIVMGGAVNGTAKIFGEAVTVNGTVAGDTVISAQRIVLGDKAKFFGNVRYWSADGEMSFAEKLAGGTATYDPSLAFTGGKHASAKKFIGPMLGMWFLFSALAGFFIILVLVVWLAPYTRMIAHKVEESFWKRTGVGLLFCIVMPVVSIVLLVTVVGWALGLFGLAAFLFMLYIVKPIAAIMLVQWYTHVNKKDWSKAALFFAAATVFLVMKVLYFIPIIGWIALLIIGFATIGAMLSVKADLYKKSHLIE